MDWHRENISDKKNCIKLGIRNKKSKLELACLEKEDSRGNYRRESQNLKLSGDNCEEKIKDNWYFKPGWRVNASNKNMDLRIILLSGEIGWARGKKWSESCTKK